MITFNGGKIQLSPGDITLTLKGGCCDYKVHGFATRCFNKEGMEMVELHDDKGHPVARFARDLVESLVFKL